jgi:formylglycine-generating enzyme required for sulfatase activity
MTPAERNPTRSGKSFTLAFVGVMVVIVVAAAYWLWIHRTPAIPGMAYFPAGVFLAGSDKKEINLGAFFIDETEVTNAEFGEYCRVTNACKPPTEAADLPVVNITMAQARAYAKWRGKRLPTQLEWERAVRSADGVKYPWGDAEDAGLANVRDNPILLEHKLVPVRSYRPLPVYQMAGNAWEMVEDAATPDDATVELFAQYLTPAPSRSEPWIQIRGGSFNTPLESAVGYNFKVIPERYSSAEIGFRCARSRDQ